MRVILSLLIIAGLFAAPQPLFAKDKLKPISDYNRIMRKEMKRATPEEKKAAAIEYLDAWKATGRSASGTARYALAQFQQVAERYKDAAAGFKAVRTDDEVKAKFRHMSARAEAGLLTLPGFLGATDPVVVDAMTKDLCTFAENTSEKKDRNKLRAILATAYTIGGQAKASQEMRLKIVADDPKSVGTHARLIMEGLLSATHKQDGYDALRKQAAGVLKTLTDAQSGVVAAAKAKLDAAKGKLPAGALDGDGNLNQTDRKAMTKAEKAYGGAKRSYDSATALLATIPPYAAPFELLGKPAAAWTLEKAYSEDFTALDTLKGKVVLLDFWNTWGKSCSFPVVRDLLKAYGEKGLAVVGVTVTSNVVYPTRYDFDADFKSKDDGEKRFAARLATEKEPSNGQWILDEGPYREKEHEAIAVFIENHELKWPHVMISKDDAETKFARTTWPHTVLIDKQGRVRMIRGGALVREQKKVVAQLKKVIDDLLAE